MPDTSHTLAFGGVLFDFQNRETLASIRERLHAQHIDCISEGPPAESVCRAFCKPADPRLRKVLQAEISLRDQTSPEMRRIIDTKLTDDLTLVVVTAFCGAAIKPQSRNTNHIVQTTYDVTYHLEGTDAGPLLSALATVIMQREGALIVHSSVAEIEGAAVAFVGPSEAGKTTTCNNLSGARWFARDRSCFHKHLGKWHVWALPGGDDVHLEKSTAHRLPLKAVCRIQQDDSVTEPVIKQASPARAAMILRESIQAQTLEPEQEERLLTIALCLSEEVLVCDLHRTRHHDVVKLFA